MRSIAASLVTGILLTFLLAGCGPQAQDAEKPAVEPSPRSDVDTSAANDTSTQSTRIPPDTGSVRARPNVQPGAETRRVRGQTVYVPAYAHIYFQDRDRTVDLTTTLSIHNIDADHTIRLTAVEYYNSDGELVRRPMEEVSPLRPFASTWYVIEESELSGGVGANFIVRWESEEPVHPPVIETVMISTRQSQGISFTSHGRVLEEW